MHSIYSVIWKYTIKPENKLQFEQEYGVKGCWNKLFSKSKNYKSSYLHQHNSEPTTYLLIDTWISKQSYLYFLETNKKTYQQLSASCQFLYEKEEKIGEYNLLK